MTPAPAKAANPGPPLAAGKAEVQELVEHLFRREAAKMVAGLTRLFGVERLPLVEDVVQEALLQALRTWPYADIPANPAAWLYQVAKRKAIDILRRQSVESRILKGLSEAIGSSDADIEAQVEQLWTESEIPDDTLRMIFMCCHPALSLESQVGLALNLLCGLSSAEIAQALLKQEATVQKRLYRAKQRLRQLDVPFAVPTGEELGKRLHAVLKVLYLMFNEGYLSSSDEQPIRREVCQEALRLCVVLCKHPATAHPDAFALRALMCFHMARFDARLDGSGHILTLKEQDRSRWDQDLIGEGLQYLERSVAEGQMGPMQLEAAIAATHCLAHRYEETDWESIVRLYDGLVELAPSPIIALNRAIALAELYGAEAGLQALENVPQRGFLQDYHLYYATIAELHLRLNAVEEARRELEQALRLARSSAERALLRQRLARIPRGREGALLAE